MTNPETSGDNVVIRPEPATLASDQEPDNDTTTIEGQQ